MKKTAFFLLFAIFLTSIAIAQNNEGLTRKQQKAEQKATLKKELKKMVDTQTIKFIARQAYPMSGSSVALTSYYTLQLKNDSAYAYLPYFGVAYQAEYASTDGGIKFEEKMAAYKTSLVKGAYEIEFSAKSPKDSYWCSLSISQEGYATLIVNSQHRQQIRFYGIIDGLGI